MSPAESLKAVALYHSVGEKANPRKIFPVLPPPKNMAKNPAESQKKD
jgi:hypothetical protein